MNIISSQNIDEISNPFLDPVAQAIQQKQNVLKINKFIPPMHLTQETSNCTYFRKADKPASQDNSIGVSNIVINTSFDSDLTNATVLGDVLDNTGEPINQLIPSNISDNTIIVNQNVQPQSLLS